MAGWPLPPTHSKVVHAVAAALYNRFNTPLTSIKQEHLETLHKSSITIKQQLCTPSYDITVALEKNALHFLKLHLTV